jgi:hypothetical protein
VSTKAEINLAKARAKSVEKVKTYRDFLDTPNGKIIMEDLKEQFDPPVLCKVSADTTVVRAAQRDVIRYIEDMAKGAEK